MGNDYMTNEQVLEVYKQLGLLTEAERQRFANAHLQEQPTEAPVRIRIANSADNIPIISTDADIQ